MIRPLLLALIAYTASGQVFPFEIAQAGEAVATLRMSAPGTSWERTGHEAAIADVSVDRRPAFQVMLFAGSEVRDYTVFLGHLKPGRHSILIERNKSYSAPGSSVVVESAAFRGGITDAATLHAPILYARKNTIGKFTDVPIIVYAETSPESLTYTVIFSNEDGGTSTRALMARWGRTTDIEYVYRLDLKSGHAIIQGRGHKDIEYGGKLEGGHPLLIPVTDNNMVGDETPSEVCYRIAPVLAGMSANSREKVMDDDPLSYALMAKELEREDKLRPYGVVDGNKVSDPRNYLYVEAKVRVANSGVVAMARRKDDKLWRSSSLGRVDYAIDRSGWIRTTIEFPPGTKASDLGDIGFTCVLVPDSERKMPVTGTCDIEAVSKAFLLDSNYRPQSSWLSVSEAVHLNAGEAILPAPAIKTTP